MPRCFNDAGQAATTGAARQQRGESTGAPKVRRDRATRAQQRAANPDKRGAHTTPMGTFAMLTCIALAGYAGTTPEHVARRQGFGHTAWVNAERRYKETKRASPKKQQTRGPRRKLNDGEWADLYTELCDKQGEGYRDIALKYGVSIATISRECGTQEVFL